MAAILGLDFGAVSKITQEAVPCADGNRSNGWWARAIEIWEVGAGKALSGMVRRIHRDAAVRTVGTAADVAAAVEGT